MNASMTERERRRYFGGVGFALLILLASKLMSARVESNTKPDLLRLMADGWMAWDVSTTPIPISTAANLTKAILAGRVQDLPPEIAAEVDPNGYETVPISIAWKYVRNQRFQRLMDACGGTPESRESCSKAVNVADTRFGLTPLHLARLSRDDVAADFLLQLGADENAFDTAGRKPANLSFTNFVRNARASAQAAGRTCEIPEVHVDEGGSWKAEVRRLVREGEPVMIRGAVKGEPWTLERLVQKFGDRQVRVGDVPYAEYFGKKITHHTLKDFVDSSVRGDDDGGLPKYVFAKEEGIGAEGYGTVLDIVSQAFPIGEMFDDPQRFGAPALHFALGRKGSGAPIHVHADALNLVLAGEKRWFLLPPQDALYSRKHVFEWVRDDLEHLSPRPLECVQRAGDAVYVPFDWAHSVINDGEFTFAYALELLSLRDSLTSFK